MIYTYVMAHFWPWFFIGGCVFLAAVIGFTVWHILSGPADDWDDDWQHAPEDLPGPVSLPAPRAGEYHRAMRLIGQPREVTWEEFSQDEPDQAADQLIAEWHDEPHERAWSPALVESLTDDPDLLLWDIRCQVTRIQEIRAELADLKRELCAA